MNINPKTPKINTKNRSRLDYDEVLTADLQGENASKMAPYNEWCASLRQVITVYKERG